MTKQSIRPRHRMSSAAGSAEPPSALPRLIDRSMIAKSEFWFPEKIMLYQEISHDDDSAKSHRDLEGSKADDPIGRNVALE